jgi:hypothetical protein
MAFRTADSGVRGILICGVFRSHYLMAQFTAEFRRFREMITLIYNHNEKHKDEKSSRYGDESQSELLWVV